MNLILEGLGVMLTSIAICGALGIAAAVLEGKPDEEVARWGYWGTTIGVLLGIPLTLSAFVVFTRP
jgi:uncharacterized protein YqgC (DUF456 family)